ncbi:AraC family transcriptional regulator N-terminal domain-containing protein [Paenibacillus rhizophilus]|nr:AraC family transcriptional regulator N-terminal domain-containing protein [Paenibacillus rhizophilus]
MAAKENAKRALFVSKIESSILDAILRLTHLLDNPKDKKLPQMK